MNFNEIITTEPILRAITEFGYTSMTPIQQNAIPLILDGGDIIGLAQTGTGKTAAFAVPMLQLLNETKAGKRGVRALILTPTRELAIQIADNFEQYGKHLSLSHTAIFGGVPQGKQVAQLQKGIDILIATPGRLLDLMQQGFINLSKIEILVLDEADRMLDMGFVHDVKRVLAKVPVNRQTLFFSATMPPSIRKFADSILKKPRVVSITPVSSTAKTVKQSVYFVEKKDKTSLLVDLLKTQQMDRSLVFTTTKRGANKLVEQLAKKGIEASAIHGNKSQNARQRALEDFKNSKIRVLIATDIAARGIDIQELPFVVNYELPNIPETYVHRIGRTGRAGLDGVAISFCESEERGYLRNIQKLTGTNMQVVRRSGESVPSL
jgi:ATP-dependent RNA helicase RhlE